jgi:two-component system LytT family response regulator
MMNTAAAPLSVYLVDDEPLALRRLARLLRATQRVEIVGMTTEPGEALRFLSTHSVDAVFVDIQMPRLSGFDLLEKLPVQPLVVFTTAYDQYALRAFKVYSIDYLLKPIGQAELDRALTKLERLRGSIVHAPAAEQIRAVARQLAEELRGVRKFSDRIASKLGDRVIFVDLAAITHFYAKDKLTYAATSSRDYVVADTISSLEERLDPEKFIRIHRATLLNTAFVDEISSWFGGAMTVRLKDSKRTRLQVARDRATEFRRRMGLRGIRETIE